MEAAWIIFAAFTLLLWPILVAVVGYALWYAIKNRNERMD